MWRGLWQQQEMPHQPESIAGEAPVLLKKMKNPGIDTRERVMKE